jgi:nitrite reductase/ring-hydroxylating ferredoxin subunit
MNEKTTCQSTHAPCAGVSSDVRTNRREFVRSAGCFALAIATLGLGISDASALTVSMVDGTGDGAERRYPIPATDGVNIDRTAQIIVARSQGHVYAFALSCPHQNNAVKWVAKESRFQCTKHDSQYRPDGVYTSGRSTRNLDRYVVRREGESLVVDLHKWVQSDKDPKAWGAAAIAV